jgi:hypothetical protein
VPKLYHTHGFPQASEAHALCLCGLPEHICPFLKLKSGHCRGRWDSEHRSGCHSNLKVRVSKYKRKCPTGLQAPMARLNHAVAGSMAEITFLSNDTSYSSEPESLKEQMLCATGYSSHFYYSSYLSAVRCRPNRCFPILHKKGRWIREIS